MQLTPSQNQMWVGQQLQPDSPFLTQCMSWLISGPIDEDRFARAIREVTERIEIFRLTFSTIDGHAEQALGPRPAGKHQYVDLSSAPAEQALRLGELKEAAATSVFDLSRALWSSYLVKLSADEYAWILSQHHLITDVTSCAFIFNAVQSAYEGKPWDAAEQWLTPVQTFYNKDSSASPRQQRSAEFWHKQNARVERANKQDNTPYGLPRGPRHDLARSKTLKFSVDRAKSFDKQTGYFGGLSLSDDITLSSIYAAALMSFMTRTTGCTTQRLGLLVHGRSAPDLKRVVGPLIETIPVYAEIDVSVSFLELVQSLINYLQSALRHTVPGCTAYLDRQSFDIMLNVQTAKFGSFAGYPVVTDLVLNGRNDASQLLRLNVMDYAQTGLAQLLLQTNNHTFDAEMHDLFCEQFECYLSNAVTNADSALIDIRLDAHPPSQKSVDRQIAVAAPACESLLNILDRIGQHSGVAIVDTRNTQDPPITYAELTEHVFVLAQALRDLGLKHGDAVAVCLPPGTNSVISILAVLSAGCTFVPINPDMPVAAMSTLADELEKFVGYQPHVLTDATSRDICAKSFAPDHVHNVSELHKGVNKKTQSGQASWARKPGDLCYILFTSGSTGEPKGVCVSDDNFAGYISWAHSVYANGEPLNMPLFTSIAFDLTLTSIFLPLYAGAKIHVHGNNSGDDVLTTLRSLSIDKELHTIKLTPSHLSVLLELPHGLDGLQQLILGGEMFSTALAAKAEKHFGRSVTMFNEYGPTECTVGCMIYRRNADYTHLSSVPIGEAIDRNSVEIIDKFGQPAPVGVVGELHVTGACVSRGYLNQPLLTSQKFDFSSGSSRYKTGDLARKRADGVIEYIGRQDRQVKFNGVRIELDEIDNALCQHSRVTQSYTCLVEHHGRTQLVTYCVTDSPFRHQEMRSHLGQYLPRTHFPSLIENVPQLPLSSNGKVDEKALPAPKQRPAASDPGNLSAQERLLLDAWRDALSDPSITLNSHFYQHGGDSLTAVRIAAQLASQGWQLNPNVMLDQASVLVAAGLMQPLQEETQASAELSLSASDKNALTHLFDQ